MTRVPRNKGSYRQRRSGSGFQVRYPLGWNEEKKKYEDYLEEVPTEAEAIALIKLINDYVYHGGIVSDIPYWRKGVLEEKKKQSIPTLDEFFFTFIEIRQKQQAVSDRTLESDKDCYKRIQPYLGSKKLNEIAPLDIDRTYASMRSPGSDNLNGRVYSGTTIQKSHAFLNMLLNKAVDYELISKNPCAKVANPKRDTEEKFSLSAKEAQNLVSFILAEPLHSRAIGVLIALSCGLRLSEMLALTWHDFKNASLDVCKSLKREKQAYKSTKNGEERIVPCPVFLVKVLEEWRAKQQLWYEKVGLDWGKDVPIVNSSVGNHVLQRSYEKWFKSERLRYPVPDDMGFHSLRHTYVTLISRDCATDDETARSLSGHKTNAAFSQYTHTNEEWQRRATDKLGAIIAPTNDEKICQLCSMWSRSPIDSMKGVCWAENENLSPRVTDAFEKCETGKFVRSFVCSDDLDRNNNNSLVHKEKTIAVLCVLPIMKKKLNFKTTFSYSWEMAS